MLWRLAFMRWLKRSVFWVCLLLIAIVGVSNVWIVKSTEEKVYSDLELLPDHRVALVLGTLGSNAAVTKIWGIK